MFLEVHFILSVYSWNENKANFSLKIVNKLSNEIRQWTTKVVVATEDAPAFAVITAVSIWI